LADDQVGQLVGLRVGSREPEDPIVACVHDVEIPVLVDRNAGGSGEARAERCARPQPGCGIKVPLSNNEVRFCAVGKTYAAFPPQYPIVDRIADIEDGRVYGSVERRCLGPIKLSALNQIRIPGVDRELRLTDSP